MPTLELKNPTTTDNSVANSIPFNDWIAKTIQKTYSRPGDSVIYRPPSSFQDNPELNLLNEKITVSIGVETNPDGTSRSGISGKGNTIVDDVNPQSGPIDPNVSTRWEGGGTPVVDAKQIQVTRAELPSVLAQDTNATFKDSLLGDKEYKVSDFFANQKKFENLKNTDSTVGNSIYSKFINYDGSKTDILYDKSNANQPSIIPTRTAIWGQDQNQQEYVKQKLIETNGYDADYVKRLTNRMLVFPNIQIQDTNTQSSIIKGEFGYDGIARVEMTQEDIDPMEFAKNLAKLNNDKLDINDLIKGSESKEIRYDLNGRPIITNRGDYQWNEAVKKFSTNKDLNVTPDEFFNGALGVFEAGLDSVFTRGLATIDSPNASPIDRGIKASLASSFNTGNTVFSNLSDAWANGIAAGYFNNLASFGEGLIKNDPSKVKLYKPEENTALSLANAKALQKSFSDPFTGKAPENFIEGALNLSQNIVRGDAKLFDRKVINEQIANTAKVNTQQTLKKMGLKEDFEIAKGIKVADAAATFTVGTVDFAGTVALSKGVGWAKGANLLGAASKLLPGWAGISMFAKDYRNIPIQDRYKEAAKTFASAKFEQVVQDGILEPVFDKATLWLAQGQGSKLLADVLTTPGLVSQFDDAFVQMAGLAKAPLKYKLMNATGNGLIEFGVGVGGDALINSAFEGKWKNPTGDDWVQNALFGAFFAAAPKLMKSNPQMFSEVVNNLKVDKLGESVHGDLDSVIDKMSLDTDRIDVLNKRIFPNGGQAPSTKESFSQTIKQVFDIQDLSTKGNFTLTESLSRDALFNLVGNTTKEKGSKVTPSQRILNELLSRAAQATPDSPYNGFTKIYTLDGVNPQGDKTSEVFAVGVDKDLKPILLTSDDLLKESGLETAKKTNLAISVLSNLVGSKYYADFNNAQRGDIATYFAGNQPRMKFKDKTGNWINLDGSDGSSTPPTGSDLSLNVEQALDFAGVKEPINQLLRGNASDPVVSQELLKVFNEEGLRGTLNRLKETIVDPSNIVDAQNIDFDLNEDYTKELVAEEEAIREVIPNENTIKEYKAGDILSDIIPEKVSQAGAEAIINYVPKLTVDQQFKLIVSIPNGISNNVKNFKAYIDTYNEYKDQVQEIADEVKEDIQKETVPQEAKATKESEQSAKSTETTQDSVVKAEPKVGNKAFFAMMGEAKKKNFEEEDVVRLTKIMTGNDFEDFDDLRLNITSQENTNLGNFFQNITILNTREFPYQNNLRNKKLEKGMSRDEFRKASPPPVKVTKVADKVVVPTETKPPETDKPSEAKPKETTPEIAPIKEEASKDTQGTKKKPGIAYNKEPKSIPTKKENTEKKPTIPKTGTVQKQSIKEEKVSSSKMEPTTSKLTGAKVAPTQTKKTKPPIEKSSDTVPVAEAVQEEKVPAPRPKIDAEAVQKKELDAFKKMETELAIGVTKQENFLNDDNWNTLKEYVVQERKLPIYSRINKVKLGSYAFNPLSKMIELGSYNLPITMENPPISGTKDFPEVVSNAIRDLIISNKLVDLANVQDKNATYNDVFIKSGSKSQNKDKYRETVQEIQNMIYRLDNPDNNLIPKVLNNLGDIQTNSLASKNITLESIDESKLKRKYQEFALEILQTEDYTKYPTYIVTESLGSKYDQFLNRVSDFWKDPEQYQKVSLETKTVPSVRSSLKDFDISWEDLGFDLQEKVTDVYKRIYNDGQTGFNASTIARFWNEGKNIPISEAKFLTETSKLENFADEVNTLFMGETAVEVALRKEQVQQYIKDNSIKSSFEESLDGVKYGQIITYSGPKTTFGLDNQIDINKGDKIFVLGKNDDLDFILAVKEEAKPADVDEELDIEQIIKFKTEPLQDTEKVAAIFDLPTLQDAKTFTQSYFLKNSNNKKLTKKDTDKVKAGDILSYTGENIPGKLKKEQKLIAKESAQGGLLRLYPLTDIKNLYNERNANVPTATKWETIRANPQRVVAELNDPIYETLEPISFKSMDETKETTSVKDKLDLSKETKFYEIDAALNNNDIPTYEKLLAELSKEERKDYDNWVDNSGGSDSGSNQLFYSPSTAASVTDYSSETLKNNIIQNLSIADVNTLNNTAITTRSIRFGGDIMDKISNNSKRKLQSLLVDISNGNIGLSDGGGKLLEPATIVAFQKEITKRINTGKAIDMEFLANTVINGESLWRVINRSQNRNNIPMMEMNQELLDKGILEPVPTAGRLLVEKDDKVKVKLLIGNQASTYHIHLLPHLGEYLVRNKGFIKIKTSSNTFFHKQNREINKQIIRKANKENIEFLEKIKQGNNLDKNFSQLLDKIKQGSIKMIISKTGNLSLDTSGVGTLVYNNISPQNLDTLRAVSQVLNSFDNPSLDKNRQFSNTLTNIIQTYDQLSPNNSINLLLSELLGTSYPGNPRRKSNYNENIERGVSRVLGELRQNAQGRRPYEVLQMELPNERGGTGGTNQESISDATRSVYQQGVDTVKKDNLSLDFNIDTQAESYDNNALEINKLLRNIRFDGGQDQLDGQLALLRQVLPDDSSIKFINNIREIYPQLSLGFENIRLLTAKDISNGSSGRYNMANKTILINPFSNRLDIIFHELVHAKESITDKQIIADRISKNPNNFLELMYAFSVLDDGTDYYFTKRVEAYLKQAIQPENDLYKAEANKSYIKPIIESIKEGRVNDATRIFGEFFNELPRTFQYNLASEFNAHFQQMMIATGNIDKLDLFTSISDVPQGLVNIIMNPILPESISNTDRFLIPASNQMEQAFKESPTGKESQQVQWNQILSDDMKINLFKIQRAQRDDLAALQEMNKDLIRINNSKKSSITMEDSQKEAIQTLNTLKKDLTTIKDYNSKGYDQWVNAYNDLADKLPTLDSQLAAMKYIGINQPVIDTMNNLLAIDPGYLKLRLDTIKFNTKTEAEYRPGLVRKGAVNFRDKSLYITLIRDNKNLQTTIIHELSHLLFDESARNALRKELIQEPTRIFDIFDSLNSGKDVINSYLQSAKSFAIKEYGLYNTPEQTDKYVAKLDNQLAMMTNIKDTMFYRSLVGQFYSGLNSAGKGKIETEYFAHLMEMAYQDGDYQTIRELLKPTNRVPIQLGFGQRGEYLSYNPMMDGRLEGNLKQKLNNLLNSGVQQNSTILNNNIDETKQKLNQLFNTKPSTEPKGKIDLTVYRNGKTHNGNVNTIDEYNRLKNEGYKIINGYVDFSLSGLTSYETGKKTMLTSFESGQMIVDSMNLEGAGLTSFNGDGLIVKYALNLSRNNLTSFEAKGMEVPMGQLDISYNKLKSFDGRGMKTALSRLKLNNNQIEKFNGDGLSVAGDLDLSFNNLESFDGKGLDVEYDLKLIKNNLKSFEASGSRIGGDLDLSGNDLKFFNGKDLKVEGEISVKQNESIVKSLDEFYEESIKREYPEQFQDWMLDTLEGYKKPGKGLNEYSKGKGVFITRGTDLDGLLKTYDSAFYFPSIAVSANKTVSSFGDITLLFDEAVLNNEQSILYSEDAYTATITSRPNAIILEYLRMRESEGRMVFSKLGAFNKIDKKDFQQFIEDIRKRKTSELEPAYYAELKVYGKLPANYTRAILAPAEYKKEIESKLNNTPNTPIYYYSSELEHFKLMDKIADDLEAKGERIRYRDGNLGLVPNSFNNLATNSLKQILGKTLERIPAKGIALEVATREELMKVAEDNGIKLRFIGDIGANNLSNPIILENRQVADQMEKEGITPSKIKYATGWEKGLDGNWRYEAADLPEYDLSKIKPNGKYKLRDLLKSDSILAKEYPKIMDASIEFMEVIADSPDILGQTSYFYQTIKLANKLINNQSYTFDEVYSTLIHEIQHFIQNIEGFSKGGTSFIIDEGMPIKDDKEIATKGRTNEAYDNYTRLAGEVEARNVESRRFYNDISIRNAIASATEDVPRDRQFKDIPKSPKKTFTIGIGSQGRPIGSPTMGISIPGITMPFKRTLPNDVENNAIPSPALTAYGSFQTVEGRKGILTLLDTIVNPKNEADAIQGILTANHELGHAFVATLPEDIRESFLRTVAEFNTSLTKDNSLDNAEEVAVEYLAREMALKDSISTQEANQKAKTLWEQFKSFVSRMWKALTNLVRTGKLDIALDQSVIDQVIVDEFTRLRDEFVQDENINTEKLAPFVQEFSNWLNDANQFEAKKVEVNNSIERVLRNLVDKIPFLKNLFSNVTISSTPKFRIEADTDSLSLDNKTKIYKKQFGETNARLIRSIMPVAFDKEQDLITFLKEKIPIKSQMPFILDKIGGSLEMEFLQQNQIKKVETTTSPFDLLKQIGYTLSKTESSEEVNSFRSYYLSNDGKTENGGSIICTYNNVEGRLSGNIILFVVKEDANETFRAIELNQDNLSNSWKEYLEKNNRKNQDGTYDLEGLKNNREDPFSTSVLSIQVGKDTGYLKVISRYNDAIQEGNTNPDAVFDTNLDKLVDGLSSSLYNYLNIKQPEFNGIISLEGTNITGDAKGSLYSYAEKVNDDYYGDGFYIKDNKTTILNPDSERMVNGFIFNQNGKIDKVVSDDAEFILKDDIIDKIIFSGTNTILLKTQNGNIEFSTENGQIKSIINIDANYKFKKLEDLYGAIIEDNSIILNSIDSGTGKYLNLFWDSKIKKIKGDADFSGVKLSSLENLEYIGGYTDLRNSDIKFLNRLKYVGNTLNIQSSKVQSLENLEYIGGSVLFSGSAVKSLNNLEYVGKDANFTNSSIQSLNNIKFIGKNADFNYTQITSFDTFKSLEYVGGIGFFNGYPKRFINNLDADKTKVKFDSYKKSKLVEFNSEPKKGQIKFRTERPKRPNNNTETFNPEAKSQAGNQAQGPTRPESQQQAQIVEDTGPSLPPQTKTQQTSQEPAIVVDRDDDETLQTKVSQEETKDLAMREYNEMLKVVNRKNPKNLFSKTFGAITGTGEVIGELLNSRADLLSNLKDKQSNFREYEIEAGTEALGVVATIKNAADKAKEKFDKNFSPLNPIAKAKAEEDAFYLKMFTGERIPGKNSIGELPPIGFTYDSNLDKVVQVYENVVKTVSDQVPYSRISVSDSIYAGNTIEKIFSETPLGTILVTYYYDPKVDKDKESAVMIPKRVKPLDRLRFEEAVEKGALNSIDDILKQVTETSENKSVNNIIISGIVTPISAYTVNQPLDFLVDGKSAREMVINKERNGEFSQAVKDYATAMRDLTTKLGRLKKINGLSSTEGNAYTNIPLKAISPETSKTKKNDPNIKTEFGRKSETAQDIVSRGDYNPNLTASISENIINSERQLEEKLFFQRVIQTKWLVKQSNKDGSKSTVDLEYEKLVEIEKELEKKDLPKQAREAYELSRNEIIRLFGRPTQNVTDRYNTYYNSLIGVDGDVYRINGAVQQALFVAGKVDVPASPETTKDITVGLDLLQKGYSLGNGVTEWYNSNVATQLIANVYKQKVAAILNTPKLLVQNTLQVLLDGIFGTVRGLTTDLLTGRVFTSNYFPSTVTTIAQIPSIVINTTNSEYANFLNALDKALGHEEFYAGYADEKTPIIAKAPENWWVFGKTLETGNRVLTSQWYQKSFNGFIWIQQYLINKLGRTIGLLNVMPRMLDKAREKGLDLKDFNPSKKEFRELLSEATNYYEQVRPSGSSAATQSVAYKSVAKAVPLEILLRGWMFSAFNISKKNLQNTLGRESTKEMRIDAIINGMLVAGSVTALLALFKPDDEDLLSNKDNPTNGGQKSSKATFPIYIPGTDGNVNVGDAATLAPAGLTTAVILKQIFDLTTNKEARNSYLEDLDRQLNPFSENSNFPKTPQAFVGETVGQLAIPFQATINRAAAIFQPNEKAIGKESAMTEFVQNAFGPNTSAVLSSWGLPVGDVPDKQYRIYNEKAKKMEEVSKPRDTFSRVMDILSPANNENINVAYLENGIKNAETQLARDKQNLVKDLSKGKITQESYNQELAKLEAKQDKFNLDTVLAPSGASSGGGSSGGGTFGKGQSLSSAISSLKSSGKGNTFSIKYNVPKTSKKKSLLDKKDISELGKGDSKTNLKLGRNDGFTTDAELSRGAKLKASGVNGGLSGLSSRLGGGISVKNPSISVKKPGSISISKGAKTSMPKLIPLKGIKARLDKDKKLKL